MNDLISRRAAIKAIDDLPNCYNGYSDTYDKAYIIEVLEELPSVEPKVEFDTESWKTTATDTPIVEYAPVKKGKWIDLRSDGRFGKETRCSQCGEIYWEWMSKFDYCPNCGAKMERSENV